MFFSRTLEGVVSEKHGDAENERFPTACTSGPPLREELVILDDAGQDESQEGDGWWLVSIPQR